MGYLYFKKSFASDMSLALKTIFDVGRLYLRGANNEVARYILLLDIALSANPKVIVELGTGPGLSSLAFFRCIQYHRSNGRGGVLHSCDMNYSAIDSLRRRVKFSPLVIAHNLSSDQFAEWWGLSSTRIDLLYIDADHSYEQSLADFEHFAPFVSPNGLVIMHDTFPMTDAHEQLKFSGTVWQTVQYIKHHYLGEFEIATIPFLCGVSVLRKKGSKYF